MQRTAVIDVVGLTRRLLDAGMPRLAAFARDTATIEAVLPAVTCSVQTTYLTGRLPTEHGIVGNGWYFRELDHVWLWRQSNRLVQSPRLWDQARARNGAFTCANTFWWYAMATTADITLTPRPLYCADGLKLPDFYTQPAALRTRLKDSLGQFPLFEFWGPRTSIRSSAWIARAARDVEEQYAPTLQLVYLPHLDYCLQRQGPDGDIAGDLRQIDDVCADLIDYFQARGVAVVLLSEYGIVPVAHPIHINRVLRAAGLLAIKQDLGRDYLDPGASQAFAVADHQVAHVYVRDAGALPTVRRLCAAVPGVADVLDGAGKRAAGLDHERAGELVLLAEPSSWFTYYFWEEDARAPDYARTVDIHNKPGYDPAELFVDPAIRFPAMKAALILARKKLGMRYKMDLIPLDAGLVKGSHGVAPRDPLDAPVLASSRPQLIPAPTVRATDVCGLLLDHVFQ
ncbi:putative AlkP superfamily pyrophosphatase or phosphodiesterase [Pseudoduganella flava]|uniref:Alkaline phosphatase family protein n=1 Tax=Pseudoduganella flava TaxID=871742 RepID=A0A562PQK2_9BURK|nr:nucleotide pyrophosphatase/phosphodiesterase family protein [Pseudoduganella flava]QGZ37850.1 alkaline phosphatase family protein [Pseudoduganella flava]TWI46679.1 putative AlkP superfamily pyrophosphatase or phosphodiesterase [Pseudoduganella flava]